MPRLQRRILIESDQFSINQPPISFGRYKIEIGNLTVVHERRLRSYFFFSLGSLGRTVVPVGGNGGVCLAKRSANTSPQVLGPPKRSYNQGGTGSLGACTCAGIDLIPNSR